MVNNSTKSRIHGQYNTFSIEGPTAVLGIHFNTPTQWYTSCYIHG